MKRCYILYVVILFIFFFIFPISPFSFAAEERITLTTYYPAPYGIYKEMRADQMAIGSTYRYDTLQDGTLMVSDHVSIGDKTLSTINQYRLLVHGVTDSVALIHTSLSSGWTHPLLVMNTSMSADQLILMQVGKFPSPNDSAAFGFKYKGAQSNDNLLTLGLWGKDSVLTITGNRNVGINTEDPQYPLEIGGNTQQISTVSGIVPQIFVNGGNVSGGGILVSDDGGFFDYNDSFTTYIGSKGIRIAGPTGPGTGTYSEGNAVLLVRGRVGIGTETPHSALDVQGSTNACVTVKYTSSSGNTFCPSNYFWVATTFTSASASAPNGFMLCCRGCTDDNRDGVCD